MIQIECNKKERFFKLFRNLPSGKRLLGTSYKYTTVSNTIRAAKTLQHYLQHRKNKSIEILDDGKILALCSANGHILTSIYDTERKVINMTNIIKNVNQKYFPIIYKDCYEQYC
mgnify:CR=1 FL=1